MLSRNHPFFPRFSELLSEASRRTPIYDIGTNARFAKEVGLVRNLFHEKDYVACGYQPNFSIGSDACDFHCDIEKLSNIPDGIAGSVLCLSVIEHVARPQIAIREIYRILKLGGLAVVSAPFFISYHGKSKNAGQQNGLRKTELQIESTHDSYSDFWRFTHEGLVCLFVNAGFATTDVYAVDGPIISRLQMLGLYHRMQKIPVLRNLIAYLDRPRLGRMTTMHYVRAQK